MSSADLIPGFEIERGLKMANQGRRPHELFVHLSKVGEDNFNPQFGLIQLRLLYGDALVAALYAFEDVEIKMPNEVKLHRIKQALARHYTSGKPLVIPIIRTAHEIL